MKQVLSHDSTAKIMKITVCPGCRPPARLCEDLSGNNKNKSLEEDDDDGTFDHNSQVMTSKDTRFNPGSGRTPGWRNKLGDVQRGAAQ